MFGIDKRDNLEIVQMTGTEFTQPSILYFNKGQEEKWMTEDEVGGWQH